MSLNLSERSDNIDCIICWQEEGELTDSGCPSKHTFHNTCIEAWLNDNFTCPLCMQFVHSRITTVKLFLNYWRKRGFSHKDEATMIFQSLSPEIQLGCIKENHHTFDYLKDKTRNNCLAFISVNTCVFFNVPKDLLTKDFYMEAFESNVFTIYFFPENFIDMELCIIAVGGSVETLKYIPEKFKTEEFYFELLKDDILTLQQIPDEQKTAKMCRLVLTKNKYAAIPEKFKTEAFYLELIKDKILTHWEIPEKIKTKEFLFELYKIDIKYFQFLPDELKTQEMCYSAVEQNSMSLFYVPKRFETPQLYLLVAEKYNNVLLFIPKEMRTAEFILTILKINRKHFDFYLIPTKLRTLKFFISAVRQDPDILPLLPARFRLEIEDLISVF